MLDSNWGPCAEQFNTLFHENRPLDLTSLFFKGQGFGFFFFFSLSYFLPPPLIHGKLSNLGMVTFVLEKICRSAGELLQRVCRRDWGIKLHLKGILFWAVLALMSKEEEKPFSLDFSVSKLL